MASDCGLQFKRRRSNQGGGDQSASGMESLPHQIILDIFSRLPLSSLVQFRYVCRSWRMLAQDQHLDNLYNSDTAENSVCLIFHCVNPIRNQLYFVDYPFNHRGKDTVKKIYTPFCASMPEFDVVGSCHGLLCLSDSLYNDALYIYNPFTRDYRELPKSMQYPNQEVIYGFGFHPVTKEYKVVKIIYYSHAYRPWDPFNDHNPKSEVQVFTLGSSTWRSVGKTSHHLDHQPAQVLVNGRIHWVTWINWRPCPHCKLISFDLADEQFREVSIPEFHGLELPGRFKGTYHLLVLRGCLATVFYCTSGKLDIWVMKEYDVKESWVKEFSIGSHMPKALKQDVDSSWNISNIAIKRRFVRERVLCVLMNGQILLEYKSRALVLYDPNSGTFKDLVFQGMPKWFQTVVHVGRLNQIHTLVNM